MAIADVVLRGFGTTAGINMIPTAGYGRFAGINTGAGRIEFTMPRSRLEYTIDNGRLEFTLPKTVEEFAEVYP